MNLFQWLKGNYAGDRQVTIPEGPRTPPVRRGYRFSGFVQGVGFRYEAKLLADRLGLVGWVRNESDGTVSAELEGEARCLDAFLRALRTVPRFDITEVRVEELPLSGIETTCRVLY